MVAGAVMAVVAREVRGAAAVIAQAAWEGAEVAVVVVLGGAEAEGTSLEAGMPERY